MEPSSPFLKILPYEVARGWVDGLNSHKVSVEGAANTIGSTSWSKILKEYSIARKLPERRLEADE